MNRDTKWIFLDMGSTLVNEWAAHISRLRSVSSKLKLFDKICSPEELIDQCEKAATSFEPNPFLATIENQNLSNMRKEELLRDVKYPKHEESLYPSVPDMLCRLSKNFKLGVVANQPSGTKTRLNNWGILDYFSFVITSNNFGVSKPDIEIFNAAIERAGCRRNQAVMVGDRIDNDISPANRIELQTVHVLQEFHRFQKPRNSIERPTATIENIIDLESLFYK